MGKQKFKLPFVFVLLGVLLSSPQPVRAQRPPTGGPNPQNPGTQFPVILYPLIGLGAAAGYLAYKKIPRKMPVGESLHAYLIRHHILPTTDAVALMYALNPGLKQKSYLRSTRKLIAPDFPPIPASLQPTPTTGEIELSARFALFQSKLETFNRSRIRFRAASTSLEKVKTALADMEKKYGAFQQAKKESGPVKTRLLTDLLEAADQALTRSLNSGVLSEQDATLLLGIAPEFEEVLAPLQEKDPPRQGYWQFLPSQDRSSYASLKALEALANPFFNFSRSSSFNEMLPSGPAARKADDALEVGFAFAIYKIDAQGKTITKGPQVEGQYFIQYVSPALKEYKSYYHNISPPPATYAAAKLPPAKFYLIVKDLKGKQVNLQNPLIDTRDIFRNPQRNYFKELILVPIYISP